MSIFSELIPKIKEISNSYRQGFNDDLEAAFKCLDKFEEEFQNEKVRATGGREKAQKDKIGMTTLQSINEDDDEPNKVPVVNQNSCESSESLSSSSSNGEKRASKKRSKNEVDDIFSPEVDKRQKRNASVKAQTMISKQVNVNLTAKMRRNQSNDRHEESNNIPDKTSSRSRRRKDDEKENSEPNVLAVQIKTEKISLPAEAMDTDSLQGIPIKQERSKDEMAMPPPAAPVPKPRKALAKEKSEDCEEENGRRRTTRTRKQAEAMPPPAALAKETSVDCEEENGRRRTTRTRKQAEAMPPPPVPSARATRASSRATRTTDTTDGEEHPAETRPKRTRAKKKVSMANTKTTDGDGSQSSQEMLSATSSPAEKPRPKRTRRGKAAEKQLPKQIEPIALKIEKISLPGSPILVTKNQSKIDPILKSSESTITINSTAGIDKLDETSGDCMDKTRVISTDLDKTKVITKDMDETVVIYKGNNNVTEDINKTKVITKDMDETVVIYKGNNNVTEDINKTKVITKDFDKTTVRSKDIDKTITLPNGVYNHAAVSPEDVRNMNETVVLHKDNRETMVIEKPQPTIMDCTVVLDKYVKTSNLTEDNSLLTDDESEQEIRTPPGNEKPATQPLSAVKEKVQQFEEMATRVTRTKTRAMAKKEEQADTQTPPDKIIKPVLSADTLTKMNSLIFNEKPHAQISQSASKPRALPPKPLASASASKLSAIGRHREAAEEDARKKKGAMLEAKREMQKRKREEKMAAAAAARCQAEKDRRAQLEAAAKERIEKQAHVDAGKLERMKEAERKKQELARKVAETEERRKAEEAARMQRLAEEQRKALQQRRKQQQEQEAMKKEAAIMAKEIEQRQKEYIEKQKLKSRIEEKILTPLKTPEYHRHGPMEPVYMVDGFQYLNSDEDAEPPPRPVPEWSTSKARKRQLEIQSHLAAVHVDRLFSVRTHSPDLRDIFPNIERARLKRTSSAVWRTPPALRTVCE